MRKQRVLVLMGAGASVGFGAPSTACLTKSIEERILADRLAKEYKADYAWFKIKSELTKYYREESHPYYDYQNIVNFEHIYHCAHELVSTFELTLPNAVGYGPDNLRYPRGPVAVKYRPVLVPFIERRTNTTKQSLQVLIQHIVDSIQEKISTACKNPKENLDLLRKFIEKLQENYITRIYTTNYDNFILQASPDLYTGFSINHESGSKRFDRQGFWAHFNQDSVFHLHGSVHINFGIRSASDPDFGSFCWYDSLDEALTHRGRTSDMRNMDGGSTVRTPIITGLNKISPLQQMPFSYYHSCLSCDAMAADIIYVIGYGLNDLHINTWLKEARWRNPKPPLLFVGRWKNELMNSFKDAIDHEKRMRLNDSSLKRFESKQSEMIHNLYMLRFKKDNYLQYGDWHFVQNEYNYAIWDKDFLGFLNAPDQLESIPEN